MAAPSVLASGTQTATLTTEHTLNDNTGAGTSGYYQLVVDINALLVGEDLELLVYEPALSAGTVRIMERIFLTGGLNDPIVKSNMHACTHGAKFTLKQTGGTGRAFPWEVRNV